MKKMLIALGIFVAFSACNHELEKPENLIPEDKMKEILTEVYLYRQVRNYRLAPNLPGAPQTNLAILDKYGVTLEQFQVSYHYYIVDNAAYDEFLNDITEKLQAELPEEEVRENEKSGTRMQRAPLSQ